MTDAAPLIFGLEATLTAQVGPGYKIRRHYYRQSPLTALPGALWTEVLADLLPAGEGLIVTDLLLKHKDDAGIEFISWALFVNGLAHAEGYDDLFGGGVLQLPIAAVILPGHRVSVVAYNKSAVSGGSMRALDTPPAGYSYPSESLTVYAYAGIRGFRFSSGV